MRLNKSDTSIKFNRGTMQLTVHPAETFPWDQFEVNSLVAVFRIDQVRKFHGIEL